MCCPEDLRQRIVQIGWAVGRTSEPATTKEYLVQPCGFEISAKASQKHGVSQEQALAQGAPLRSALEEFMRDVVDAYADGGRLGSHHLEFE